MTSPNRPRTPDFLERLANWSAWVIVVICSGLGLLFLTQGFSGIHFAAAFFGFAGAVCPKLQIHWSLRLLVGIVCLAILS